MSLPERAAYRVFDGHNDIPWAYRDLVGYDLDELDFADTAAGLAAGTHTDLGRISAGGLAAQFWSVFVPAQLRGADAVTATLEQIDFVNALVDRYDALVRAETVADVERAWAEGRVASLMGAEGGHQIDESLGVLRMYRRLGVRYLTLTHNDNVPWADSATDEPVLGGLSDFGREVVAEMNRIGMLVDLSHVSADVMRQALEVSRAPVMFSHSSARAVCDHVRNVPDDVLAALGTNGGLCMVTFVPKFVTPAVRDWDAEAAESASAEGITPTDLTQLMPWLASYAAKNPPPPSTLEDVARHVEHVREVAGIDHVGIGGDYDGSDWFPEGLQDVTGYPRLLDLLGERGWSEGDLAKLTHRNVLRVLDAAQTAS